MTINAAVLVGTIAFAISGTMVAIRRKMDIFGVNILAVATAAGGGMIRDLIIGQHPPVLFRNPLYVLIAILTANISFLIVYIQRRKCKSNKYVNILCESILFWCDALGLAVFTVDGVNIGVSAGFVTNRFLLIFLGVVTGVGGGVLRDVLANETPYILVKHVYACASFVGAGVTAALWMKVGREAAMLYGFVTILSIRVLAKYYKWNLPKL